MKKNPIPLLALVWSCSLTSAFADAGGTSSGGGRIFKDAGNPWFLENSAEVKYCLEIEPNFGVTLDKARGHVSKAINSWKKFLSEADPFPHGHIKDPLYIATQAFREEPCQESTDVRFQFGVLHEHQRCLPAKPDRIRGRRLCILTL